ncbi:hypothetical protein DPMN_160923 [Dreissena polymorpha]|uniref:Uncharacterized protein n=1 Tax=Dreissena polymorpha TaxID=45954 RepID=A0A9D4EMH3_DREPO|nr:hypothetical protein DPMN_160923 [Dreissena polymorpha]
MDCLPKAAVHRLNNNPNERGQYTALYNSHVVLYCPVNRHMLIHCPVQHPHGNILPCTTVRWYCTALYKCHMEIYCSVQEPHSDILPCTTSTWPLYFSRTSPAHSSSRSTLNEIDNLSLSSSESGTSFYLNKAVVTASYTNNSPWCS